MSSARSSETMRPMHSYTIAVELEETGGLMVSVPPGGDGEDRTPDLLHAI